MDAAPAGSPPDRKRPRVSKNAKIGLGLLFTLGGLALVSLGFPISPYANGALFGAVAAGVFALWVGGILMGVGSRS